MDKKKYSCYHSKIESNQDLSKFREDNKDKIPEGVTVERAPRSSINETLPEDEILIHPSTFKLGLCLPFHVLIEEILSELHLYPFQLSPNCWRVMFGIIALNQICKINLGWNEFCHCYAVKKNSGDNYYFSHKKGNEILVTGLPKSEKGWKLDDLIRLKGDCLVPRAKTAADHKPKDVNKCDIEKALELPNRDWKYLVDHASKLELHIESKIADESQSTLLTATGPAYSNLGGDVRSVEVVSLTTTDVLSSPPSSCKRQKLMPCDSNASLAANLVPPYPVCSDYESSILSEAAAGNSKVTTDYVNHEQGSEDQETVDQSKKNINSVDQHLKHKSFEEARSLGAESFLRLVDSYMNHIKDQDKRIEELKAAYERKDKELEELKLLKKEEAAFIKELKAAYERKNKELEELKLLKKEAAYKIIDKMYDAMIEREEANKPRLPTRMESPSSSSFKNAGHLTSQSQNNHNIEGAADGVTPPNTGLKQHQQQQIIGPSSLNNSSNLLTLLGQTILLDNSFDCFSTINAAAAADH